MTTYFSFSPRGTSRKAGRRSGMWLMVLLIHNEPLVKGTSAIRYNSVTMPTRGLSSNARRALRCRSNEVRDRLKFPGSPPHQIPTRRGAGLTLPGKPMPPLGIRPCAPRLGREDEACWLICRPPMPKSES